jgi:hypothetical protein
MFVVRKCLSNVWSDSSPVLNTKTCSEFCDDRTPKISASVHFLIESYAIPNPILAAVQTATQGLGKGFRAIERQNLIMR